MDQATLAPVSTDFPLTERSLPRLKSMALKRDLSFAEVIQEARVLEWTLRKKELEDGIPVSTRYFWRALVWKLMDVMCAQDDSFYRPQVYKQRDEYGKLHVSDEPFFPGQKKSRVRSSHSIVSLNHLMDINSALFSSEAGLIDCQAFDDLWIQDTIKEYVDMVTKMSDGCHGNAKSLWKLSLDILNARVEDGASWDKIQETFKISVQAIRWHRRRLEDLFREFVGKSSPRARTTRGVSPNTHPVSDRVRV
jgi:hypothetical protein